ncbi:MFS transporter, partial [Salmonella enterica]|nr:MFS transporter [Salmonella enterica]EJP7706109.1 MFS transporter [Salmonella enterica]
GYMPSMFAYTLYGSLLDNFAGIRGYNYIFYVMVVFSLLGFVCATLLTRRMKNNR